MFAVGSTALADGLDEDDLRMGNTLGVGDSGPGSGADLGGAEGADSPQPVKTAVDTTSITVREHRRSRGRRQVIMRQEVSREGDVIATGRVRELAAPRSDRSSPG